MQFQQPPPSKVDLHLGRASCTGFGAGDGTTVANIHHTMEIDNEPNIPANPPRWLALLGNEPLNGHETKATRRLQRSQLPTTPEDVSYIVGDLLRLGRADVLEALFEERPFSLDRISLTLSPSGMGEEVQKAYALLLRRLLRGDATQPPVDLTIDLRSLPDALFAAFIGELAGAGPMLVLRVGTPDADEQRKGLFKALRASDRVVRLELTFQPKHAIPKAFSKFVQRTKCLSDLHLNAPTAGFPDHLREAMGLNQTLDELVLKHGAHPDLDKLLQALVRHPRLRRLKIDHRLSPAETTCLGELLIQSPRLTELVLVQGAGAGCVLPAGSLVRLETLDLQACNSSDPSDSSAFVVSVLTELCGHHVLRSFEWRDVRLMQQEQELLTRWLTTTTTLKTLRASSTFPADLQSIVLAVAGNRGLECLELSNSSQQMWSGLSIGCLMLCEALVTLSLTGIELPLMLCQQVAELVASHPTLARLGLDFCVIDSKGFEGIVSEFAGMKRIRQVDLRHSLSAEDVRVLLRALALNKGLGSLKIAAQFPAQDLITAAEIQELLAGNLSLVEVAEPLKSEIFCPDARRLLDRILMRNLRLYRPGGVAHLREAMRGLIWHRTGVEHTSDTLWREFVEALPSGDGEVFESEDSWRSLAALHIATQGSHEISRRARPSVGDNEEPARKLPKL